MGEKIIRVLVAKPGLDGHDRGAKIVARSLRDAGMDVIYTGIRQTPEMIVSAAIDKNVDVIGLSILSAAHLELFKQIIDNLSEQDRDDILIVAGGIIPEEDRLWLKEMGIVNIFGSGTPTTEIASFIRQAFSNLKN